MCGAETYLVTTVEESVGYWDMVSIVFPGSVLREKSCCKRRGRRKIPPSRGRTSLVGRFSARYLWRLAVSLMVLSLEEDDCVVGSVVAAYV